MSCKKPQQCTLLHHNFFFVKMCTTWSLRARYWYGIAIDPGPGSGTRLQGFWREIQTAVLSEWKNADMIAAPQAQRSPFSYYPSPLSFSLLLGEQKQATLEQTVPVSPSLSPLAKQNKRRNSFSSLDVLSRTTKNGQSPSPAVVPECGERAFSGSPLLRQILTGE